MDTPRTGTVPNSPDGHRTAGPSCARCQKTLGDLRDRLFGTGGELMCERCYQDARFEQFERARRRKLRRARCATVLSFGSLAALVLLLSWTRSPEALAWGVGLVTIAHVVAEILSPRARWTVWHV